VSEVYTRFKDYVLNPVEFFFACVGERPVVFFAKDITNEAKKRGYEPKNHGKRLRAQAEALGYVCVDSVPLAKEAGLSKPKAYVKAERKEQAEEIVSEALWQREKVALEAKLGRKLSE